MKRTVLLSFLTVLLSIFAIGHTARAATITVTMLTDRFATGNVPGCSLREAIQSVNIGNPFNDGCAAEFTNLPFSTDPLVPDTINLIADTYVLSLDGPNDDDNESGDLDIIKAVDIVGAGSLQTTVTASGFASDQKDRVLDIAGNAPAGITDSFLPVSLIGMTIRDGDVRTLIQAGGGIRSSGAFLTLDDAIVAENFSSQGGGIWAALSIVAVLNSEIVSNQVPTGSGDGGGIWVGETFLFMDSSTVADNSISNGSGGGIFNAGQATIINSTISGNQISVILTSTGFPAAAGFGAGIADFFRGLLVINSTISGNTAAFGGGGIAFLQGGGGAGVDGAGSQFFPGIFNVTIARNTVTDADGRGGGICNQCIPAASADVGATGDTFPIANTLIAQNQADIGPDCQGNYDGLFVSAGHNLIGDIESPNICLGFGQTGDKVGGNGNPVIDPMITDLQNNGGPTDTHGLIAGSQAIDMGDPNGCMAPTVPSDPADAINNGIGPPSELLRDQRNFPRPIDGDSNGTAICDIGAFEFQVFDFELTKVDDTGGTAVPVGDTFNYIITVTNNGPGSASNVTLDDPVPANVDVISATPSQGACTAIGNVVGCDLGDLAVGESATITVNVIAVTEGTFTNVVTLTLDNPSQQTLTRTAQVDTTIVEGLFVFGSGIHCGLSPVAPSPAALKGLLILALLSAAGLMTWRRQIQ